MRIFGHPVHPMLVHFPMAGWMLAIPCDLLGRLAGWEPALQAAPALTVAGCLLALPAMATGLVEFAGLDEDPRVLRAAYWHLGLTSTAWVLFASALLLRWTGPGWAFKAGAGDLVLSILGLAAVSAGGWYGGDLVYRHGVGVSKAREPSSGT